MSEESSTNIPVDGTEQPKPVESKVEEVTKEETSDDSEEFAEKVAAKVYAKLKADAEKKELETCRHL